MWNDERGFALPIVIAISVVLFLIGTLLIYQVKFSKQSEQLYWEQLRAQYAAESGIALMQQQLHEHSSLSVIQHQLEEIKVKTEVVTRDSSYIQLRSTAIARWNVKQTIQVRLSTQDLAIMHWFR